MNIVVIALVVIILILLFLLVKMFINNMAMVNKVTVASNIEEIRSKMNIFNTFLEMQVYKSVNHLLLNDYDIELDNNEGNVVIMSGDMVKLVTVLSDSNSKCIKFRNDRLIMPIYHNFIVKTNPKIVNIFYSYYNKKTVNNDDGLLEYIIDYTNRFINELRYNVVNQYDGYLFQIVRNNEREEAEINIRTEYNNIMVHELNKKINDLYNIDNVMDVIDVISGNFKEDNVEQPKVVQIPRETTSDDSINNPLIIKDKRMLK